MRFTDIRYCFQDGHLDTVIAALQCRIQDLAVGVEAIAQISTGQRLIWNVTTVGACSNRGAVIAHGIVDLCRVERAPCDVRAALQQDVAHVLVACAVRPVSFTACVVGNGGIELSFPGLSDTDQLPAGVVRLLLTDEGGPIIY